jgi:hypothetical protein
MGWTIEDAVSKPVDLSTRFQEKHLYKYKGKFISLSLLSKSLQIPMTSLKRYLKSMSVDTITEMVSENKLGHKKYFHNGEWKTCYNLAKELHICPSSLLRQLKKNPLETVVKDLANKKPRKNAYCIQ